MEKEMENETETGLTQGLYAAECRRLDYYLYHYGVYSRYSMYSIL